MAASPGTVYNPLYIYGRSGLGKTHLLHAVGFAAQEAQAGVRAWYLTLEEFVEQYHADMSALIFNNSPTSFGQAGDKHEYICTNDSIYQGID